MTEDKMARKKPAHLFYWERLTESPETQKQRELRTDYNGNREWGGKEIPCQMYRGLVQEIYKMLD